MNDLADRILVVLGAVLLFLINELHLLDVRPRVASGPFVHETTLRGASGADLVFLSGGDLLVRALLMAACIVAALWVVRTSLRDPA